MDTKEILKLVQAGNLEGAAAAIKSCMNSKKEEMTAEAKSFIAKQILTTKE